MSHPTMGQLLAAVRQFLDEAQPALDGRLRFHARVASNVVAIIERELDQAPDAAEAAALAPFGGAAALCAALRDGRLRPDDPAVLSAVRSAVLARLATDNPRYPTFERLRDRGQS